jgi:phosphoribosylformylglycinamidine cyclo-ligase
MKNKSYTDAGVNLEAGYLAVKKIKKLSKSTANKGTMSSIGGFAGLFDLAKYGYKDPILVSSTDGVGTKLMIAIQSHKGHDSIGQDLVGMCVNDIIAQGAKPLFFLDYFSTGNLDPNLVAQVVKGISNSLKSIDTVLIGGETAEMPDMYKKDHYDLAGFVVGAIERTKIINGKANVKNGDVLIALPSSGIHSNGFSLVRKIFFKDNNLSFEDKVPYANKTLADELLTPTKLYVNEILDLITKVEVNGIANITGGGFKENIPRVMNSDLTYKIDYKNIRVPNIFK